MVGKQSALAPWVRSDAMRGIVSFLERSEVDPVTVVGEDGLRIAEASDPYRKVDLARILQAFQKTSEVTGRMDIGLELGLQQRLTEWGPFGFLFLNAPTIGDALNDLCRYGAALQSHALFKIIEDENRFGVEYVSNHRELNGWELDAEITIAFIMSIVSGLVRKTVVPRTITFQHQAMSDVSVYKQWLGTSPDFGSRTNVVIYPARIAKQPVPNADAELYKVLKRHMRELTSVEVEEEHLLNFVRNNIERGLTGGTATLKHIAAEIGLEPRTLQRRLKDEGTSFHLLVDGVRISRAVYFLTKTRISMTDIAFELGYAEASAFTRAFKRMVGFSPNQYRKAHDSRAEAHAI